MTPALATPVAAPEDWIVCLAELRPVSDGRVLCPAVGGRSMPLATCIECRMLTWRTNDRDRADPCSTEPKNDW